MNVGGAYKVAQANTFPAGIEKGHIRHFEANRATVKRAVVRCGLTMHIKQLIPVVTHSCAAAIIAIDRPTIQHIVIMKNLEDPVVQVGAAHHGSRGTY